MCRVKQLKDACSPTENEKMSTCSLLTLLFKKYIYINRGICANEYRKFPKETQTHNHKTRTNQLRNGT